MSGRVGRFPTQPESRPRGRPRLQPLPISVVARPRGGRSSDAIARARRVRDLSAVPAASVSQASQQALFWTPGRVLEKRSQEVAAAEAPDFVAEVNGHPLTADEAKKLAFFRAQFRWCFQHDDFRGLQAEVLLEYGLRSRDVFAVWKTGGGKSVLFAIPAMTTTSLTIVVLPLVALIDDLLRNLESRHIRTIALHGQMTFDQVDSAMHRLWSTPEAVKVILISAEKLVYNPQVVPLLKKLATHGRSLRFVIDEAHCVQEWGDFRPAYSQLSLIKREFPNAPLLALTATATPDDAARIAGELNMVAPLVIYGDTERPELLYAAQNGRAAFMSKSASDLVGVLESKHRDQSGIVYVASPSAADRVCAVLKKNGIRSAAYHGKMSHEERRRVLEDWVARRTLVVVGTSAFGMGINMPDCRFVVHLQAPATLTALKQQSGRAGRDGQPGMIHLLSSPSDERIWAFIFSSSAKEQVQNERRKSGLPILDAKPLEEEVIRRTSPAHVKLREVMLFSCTPVCRRWALSVGMRSVVTSASPLRLCEEGAQSCDNCAPVPQLKVVDVTTAAQLLLAILMERPNVSLDDILDAFIRSRAKGLSADISAMDTYKEDHPRRMATTVRVTKALGDYLIGALMLCGLVHMRVIVPDILEDADPDEEDEDDLSTGAPPKFSKRIMCHMKFSVAEGTALDAILPIFNFSKA